MPKDPPGWSPATQDAASLLEPLQLRDAWAAVLLLTPPLWMVFFGARLARASFIITRPPPRGRRSLHAAVLRLAAVACSLGALALALVLVVAPAGQAWFTAFATVHFLWLGWVAVLFGFLFRLSRARSALRDLVARAGGLWLAVLSVLAAASVVLPDLIWALNAAVPPPWMAAALFAYGGGMLAQALLLPHTVAALIGDFWTAGGAQLSLESIHAVIEDRFGSPVTVDAWGLRGERHRGHQVASFRLELAQAPGQLVVSVRDPRLPADLTIRARGHGSDRISLSDPLLDGALSVSGVPPAEAERLLTDSHAVVMPIFHAHVDSVLHRQRLRLVVPGPPFRGCGEGAVEIASYVADRLDECHALVELLRRDVPSPARRPQAQREHQ